MGISLKNSKMGFYYNQQPQKGFYYNQQPQKQGFYYNQDQQKQGFYYNQPQKQGFYYNQPQKQGFYYDQPKKQGFYYNQQPEQGFYYNQQPEGFYYDNQEKGFYYDQQQKGFYYNQKPNGFYYDTEEGFYYEGFYYDGFYYDEGFYYDRPNGFYYNNGFYYDEQGFYYQNFLPEKGFYYENDEQDNQNPEFKSYWYEYAGRERMLKALNGLRTKVDQWVIQHPHDPTPDQKRAIRDVVTIQCCKDVLKTFMIHVNPDEFFKAGGDPTKLSVLLGKECQKACGKQVDYRKAWHEPGSIAEGALSSCTKDIIPFLIKWQSSEPFHKPNFAQLDALANLVASRLALEEMYAYAAATPLPKFSGNLDLDVAKYSQVLIEQIFKRLAPPKPKKR